MNEDKARRLILWSLEDWFGKDCIAQSVYLEYGAGSFDGVFQLTGPRRAYCWFWASNWKDKTEIQQSGTDKVKKVKRIGGEYVKMVGPGVLGGLAAGLIPIPGLGEAISLGLDGASGASEGGRGFMKSNLMSKTMKEVHGEQKRMAQGTDNWSVVAREQSLIGGGCVEIKDFILGRKLVRVKYYAKDQYMRTLGAVQGQVGTNMYANMEEVCSRLEPSTYALAIDPNDQVRRA